MNQEVVEKRKYTKRKNAVMNFPVIEGKLPQLENPILTYNQLNQHLSHIFNSINQLSSECMRAKLELLAEVTFTEKGKMVVLRIVKSNFEP